MRRFLFNACLASVLLSPGVRAESSLHSDTPQLSIHFTAEGVEFSGTVDSEETGQILATSVKSVRPDLAIINRGLNVDPEANLPDIGDLKSLLEELGLSTHEGILTFWEDRVLLSGLSDSVITGAALKILVEPLMKDRQLIDRICIVHTDDLPDIKVNLTTLESKETLIDFESYPTAEEGFEIPGLPLAKVYPALVMLSDLSRIKNGGGADLAPVRARPLALPQPVTTEGQSAESTPAMIQALPAERIVHYVSLPSIHFSRSTYLLQSDQAAIVEEVVTLLQEPPFAGHPITISPVRCQGGAAAFNDYLCDNRATKVKELLSARGIDVTLFSTDTISSESSIDTGEVRLRVEIPEAPAESEDQDPGEGDSNPTSEVASSPALDENPTISTPAGEIGSPDSEE